MGGGWVDGGYVVLRAKPRDATTDQTWGKPPPRLPHPPGDGRLPSTSIPWSDHSVFLRSPRGDARSVHQRVAGARDPPAENAHTIFTHTPRPPPHRWFSFSSRFLPRLSQTPFSAFTYEMGGLLRDAGTTPSSFYFLLPLLRSPSRQLRSHLLPLRMHSLASPAHVPPGPATARRCRTPSARQRIRSRG